MFMQLFFSNVVLCQDENTLDTFLKKKTFYYILVEFKFAMLCGTRNQFRIIGLKDK